MTVPISADQLIDIIYRDVFKAAVDDCESVLERPPGRNPGQAALDASSWYAGLSSGDREMLHSAIQKAADFAVFGMLCLLDNVRRIHAPRDPAVEPDGDQATEILAESFQQFMPGDDVAVSRPIEQSLGDITGLGHYRHLRVPW